LDLYVKQIFKHLRLTQILRINSEHPAMPGFCQVGAAALTRQGSAKRAKAVLRNAVPPADLAKVRIWKAAIFTAR
jgi:hypothetical protein